MTERDGASPDGEAPDRVPAGEPVEQPGSPADLHDVDQREVDPRGLEPRDLEPRELDDLGEASGEDPFEQYTPAEPTLRPDPSARELDVPFDTGQLRRLSTGQLLVVHRPDPVEDETVEVDTQRRVYSWIAAIIGTLGAVASLFVGWMLPLSIVAIVFGVLGLRREDEGRTLAFVGIGTGVAGLVFSAVWIGYYAIVFGALPH
jgi:hypothetical protein